MQDTTRYQKCRKCSVLSEIAEINSGIFGSCKEPSKSLCRMSVCLSVFIIELWLSLALYPLVNVS